MSVLVTGLRVSVGKHARLATTKTMLISTLMNRGPRAGRALVDLGIPFRRVSEFVSSRMKMTGISWFRSTVSLTATRKNADAIATLLNVSLPPPDFEAHVQRILSNLRLLGPFTNLGAEFSDTVTLALISISVGAARAQRVMQATRWDLTPPFRNLGAWLITSLVTNIVRTDTTKTLQTFDLILFGATLLSTTPNRVTLLFVGANELRVEPIVFADALAAVIVNRVEVYLLNWALPFLTVVFVVRVEGERVLILVYAVMSIVIATSIFTVVSIVSFRC